MFIVVYNLLPVARLWFCFLFKISHFQCLTAGLPILHGHHVSTEAQTDRTSGICLCFCKLDNHLFAEDKAGGKKFVGHYLLCTYQNVMMDRVFSSAQGEDVTVQDSRRQRNKDTRRLNRRRGGEGTEQVSILVLPLIPTSVPSTFSVVHAAKSYTVSL